MPDPVVSYPVDYTGQAVSNRITGEQIIITAPGDRLFHFTMPQFAPFYEDGLVLKIRDLNNNVIPLVKGVDYYLSHKFMDASLATMHPIWGSISFLRRDIVGTLLADYNTLGGPWTIDAATITEILMNTIQNPRITTWEQVVERPIDFPVIDHPWDLDDMVGQKEILQVLQDFYEAYLLSLDPEGGGGGSSIILDHINNRNNPHQVTASQAGAYSIIQIDTMLGAYLKTSDAASDSDQLNGKTLQQIMTDVAASTVANSNQFGGKNYADAKTDILTGKAADSDMLSGQTLQQIITSLQQSTGDAMTLNGKSYADIVNTIKITKVDNATHADTADNSTSVGGKTLAQIQADLAGTVPDNAHNAEKVYNLTLTQLATAIVQDPGYADGIDFLTSVLDVQHATIQHPNNGGTQDPAYTYLYLGSFPIPLTGPNLEFYDPSVQLYPTSMDLMFYYDQHTAHIRAEFLVRASDHALAMSLYSDSGDLAGAVTIGARSVPSTIHSEDGTKTGQINEIYIKFKTADLLRKVGVFQFIKNDFVVDESEELNVYDQTNVNLNDVVQWRMPTMSGFDFTITQNLASEVTARGTADTALQQAITQEATTRAQNDTTIATSVTQLGSDTQTALDGLATALNALLTTPADTPPTP